MQFLGRKNPASSAHLHCNEDWSRDTVAYLFFGLLIGEIVHRFDDGDFEHEDDIVGRSSFGTCVFFFSDFVQGGLKDCRACRLTMS